MNRKRAYPNRPKRQIDAQWRAKVEAALAAREDPAERTLTWLADRIGADQGGISRLIRTPAGKRPQNTSAWYEPINDVLRIEDERATEREKKLLEGMRKLSERNRTTIENLIESLTREG